MAVVGELAQTDAAHPELAIHRARTTAAVAPSICTGLELRRARLLDALRCLGHQSLLAFSSESSAVSVEGCSSLVSAAASGAACSVASSVAAVSAAASGSGSEVSAA